MLPLTYHFLSRMSAADLKNLIQSFDTKGDGRLAYAEFVQAMQVRTFENHLHKTR